MSDLNQNLHFNPATDKAVAVNPYSGASGISTSSTPIRDNGIDTAAEARNYQGRIQSLKTELADATVSQSRKVGAAAELKNLERALPMQIAYWKQLDAQRRSR